MIKKGSKLYDKHGHVFVVTELYAASDGMEAGFRARMLKRYGELPEYEFTMDQVGRNIFEHSGSASIWSTR